MTLEIEISGAAKLTAAAKQIKAVGNRGLGTKMRARLQEAVKPIQDDIRAEVNSVMPKSGGYRETLSRTLRFRTSIKSSARSASVKLKTYAEGKAALRDIRTLDAAGKLRHPVYGRSRRTKFGVKKNPWAVTTIRPGFWTRPVNNAAPHVRAALGKVLDDVIAELKG